MVETMRFSGTGRFRRCVTSIGRLARVSSGPPSGMVRNRCPAAAALCFFNFEPAFMFAIHATPDIAPQSELNFYRQDDPVRENRKRAIRTRPRGAAWPSVFTQISSLHQITSDIRTRDAHSRVECVVLQILVLNEEINSQTEPSGRVPVITDMRANLCFQYFFDFISTLFAVVA